MENGVYLLYWHISPLQIITRRHAVHQLLLQIGHIERRVGSSRCGLNLDEVFRGRIFPSQCRGQMARLHQKISEGMIRVCVYDGGAFGAVPGGEKGVFCGWANEMPDLALPVREGEVGEAVREQLKDLKID